MKTMAEVTTNKVIKGKQLMIFVNGKSIAAATSHSMQVSTETADTTSKDSGGMWSEIEVTKMSWTVSTENLFCVEGTGTTYDAIHDLMIAGTKIAVVFTSKSATEKDMDFAPAAGWTSDITITNVDGKASATGTAGFIGVAYYGYAYITDLSINAANGDNATFSATLTGTGGLYKLSAA